MRRFLTCALLGLLLMGQTPTPFPQTLPANTVVGRLGGGVAGPAEAIPFATVLANFCVACNRFAYSASVNFNNANTDTAVTITIPSSWHRYQVAGVLLSGASQTLSTATMGLFTGAGGTGTAIVTAGTAITVTTASESTNNNMQSFTVQNQGTMSFTNTTLYVRVATAQGAAATGTVIILVTFVS